MDGPVGILALQGDFANHAQVIEGLGRSTREVRTVEDLSGLSAFVFPGGESTTMAKGIVREDLAGPLRDLWQSGIPVFGTCAGLVLLGREHLGWLDAAVERNAYGSQVNSFETDCVYEGVGHPPVRAIFIRAPIIREIGPSVEVLAEVDGVPVAVRQDNITAISFHPEIAGESRVHAQALALNGI